MTKIDRYIQVNKRNKIYSRIRVTAIILLIVVLVPFTITAFNLFGSGDESYHYWSMTFWVIFWIQLLSTRGVEKTTKKLKDMKISEEEMQIVERQKKLDKLL